MKRCAAAKSSKGLLDFARQTKPQKQPLDLNKVAEDVLRWSEIRLHSKISPFKRNWIRNSLPCWPTRIRCGRSS